MPTAGSVHRSLAAAIEGFGYGGELLQSHVPIPGSVAAADLVAFTQAAPHDFRTAAIVAHVLHKTQTQQTVCDMARGLAAPFALVGEESSMTLFRVSASARDDLPVQTFPVEDFVLHDEVRRDLQPRSIHEAKRGARQLSLFPLDVTLLETTRLRSVETLSERVESTLDTVLSLKRWQPVEAARIVISSLAAVIVRDKYRLAATEPGEIIDAALQRHPDYFPFLAREAVESARIIEGVIRHLSDGLDYGAIDARSINSVYEQLMVTPRLRQQWGIFYTPSGFASQMLDALPIETIAPEDRLVLDPSCGSGNLLLAAQERMEAVAPGHWTELETHDWLKSHLFGWDIDPVSVEIARLSLLVSALPLGNNWRIETLDALSGAPATQTPTIIVSNPPWNNPKGSRKETAVGFVDRSITMLADGGLFACVLPSTWLTSATARASRDQVLRTCDLFEVWRLPRDVFAPEARFGCAVIFARKGRTAPRTSYAFRWVGGGKARRDDFVRRGHVTFQGLAPMPGEGDAISHGPVQSALVKPIDHVEDVSDVVSGVVQKGSLTPQKHGSIRVLPRGANYQPYRNLAADAAIPINAVRDFSPGGRDTSIFRAPQVLVQAHRSPDSAWRVRPVVDFIGVVPTDAWHAIIPKSGKDHDAYALLAVLATAVASVWVHSRCATKRITKPVLESLPLPSPWSAHLEAFADFGERLLRTGPDVASLRDLDRMAVRAYGLGSDAWRQIASLLEGEKAPEGAVRYPIETADDGRLSATATGDTRPGGVLSVADNGLRIWTVDGPEEGEVSDLPLHMPGWLAVPGSVFDVSGSDLLTARYAFHRAAYKTDEELFGVVGERNG